MFNKTSQVSKSLLFAQAILFGIIFFNPALPGVNYQSLANAETILPLDDEPEVELENDPVHDKRLDEILELLKSDSEETRIKGGIELRKFAKRGDAQKLVKNLKGGGNAEKQTFILETLAIIADRRVADAIIFEYENGSLEARRAAVTALGYLNFNYPIFALIKAAISDPDLETQKRAISALARIGTSEAIYGIKNTLFRFSPIGKNTAQWGLEMAQGKIDENKIDIDFPAGQKLVRFYKGTKYFFYHPTTPPKLYSQATKPNYNPRLLVCIHDSDLEYEKTFNACFKVAQKFQMGLLVPYFDVMRFPEYNTFNIRGERSDKRLFDIIEIIGKNAPIETKEIYYLGYGEGGQFIQNIALTYPRRVARAMIAPRDVAFPRDNEMFPKGIKINPLAPDLSADLFSFVKSDLLLISYDRSFRSVLNRFAQELQLYAITEGISSRIIFKELAGSSDVYNSEMTERFLFPAEIFSVIKEKNLGLRTE